MEKKKKTLQTASNENLKIENFKLGEKIRIAEKEISRLYFYFYLFLNVGAGTISLNGSGTISRNRSGTISWNGSGTIQLNGSGTILE